MALSGTLADVAVVDLLQLPHVGRRTGRMAISCGTRVAHVFFADGAITHAELDALRGLDVLVELLDWTEGDFQFEAGISASTRTIETDLHRCVMQALKLRDERQQELQRQKRENRPIEEVAKEKLERFLAATATVRDVALIGEGDQLIACAHREPEVDGVKELRASMAGIFSQHPRPGLSRVVMEDEAGVVMGQTVESGLLVLVFTPGTAVGIAVHAVHKLVSDVGRATGGR